MKTLLTYTDFGFRVLVLLACLFCGFVFLVAGARMALAAELRSTSVVTDSVLRVGDIFSGLDTTKANSVLGPAPQPGKEMVLNAATLMRLAKALELDWRPATTADQIVIRRSATVIGKDIIEKLVNEKLFEEGLTGDYRMSMANTVTDIVLPQEMPAQAEISQFRFDPQKDVFEATVSAPSASQPVLEMAISGTVERLVNVPVLKESLKNGDIIGHADIDFIKLPQKDVQRDFILKGETLNGMTPRRMVMAGKPIRDLELENPQIVTRGAGVTLVYKEGPMILSARGKSMQNGARGDLVRVINLNSNRSLEGIVTAENEITIVR